MQSLVVKISNPDTVHAIAEAAKRQGTTPEAAALELLETAVLAQKPFELACLKYLTISSTCTSDFRSGKGANSDK